MPRRKKAAERPKKIIDTSPGGRARGRHTRMRYSEILGRAAHYQMIFEQVWGRLWPLLSNAQTEAEVTEAFQQGAQPYDGRFVPAMAGLVLQVLREPKFLKRPST